jgi:hypothetical protein
MYQRKCLRIKMCGLNDANENAKEWKCVNLMMPTKMITNQNALTKRR